MPKHLIYRASRKREALRQGEILTGVIQFQAILGNSSSDIENAKFRPIVHPYGIIITQDCDLDWDCTARKNQDKPYKLLNSILFCAIYTAQEIRSDQNNQINSKEWDLVKSNRHQQYYFFEQVPSNCELLKEGLPELTADFKKIFAIDTEFLYQQIKLKIAKRRTILKTPYLEHFSRRYYEYHGRVALPAQHESAKGG
ncbi:hypothetical protein [Nostoc sp. CMAA1605]|uniref:hypothetical protein n=1 Tax=Nostoc sp. CMAA1605 TaxID=2055159 RepID=UPI001F3A6042|nr:hypothetical protein [Nostoc sp. CMAA1605]MCF4967852.1 hypothetical protein [Nostoc sp. CMAA1605]